MQAIKPIWKGKNWKKQKPNKADEEAAASARRQAEKELEEEGKKLLSFEDSLKKGKTEQHAKEKLADSLLTEAENKLKKAVQTGDVSDITVAQTLLETALHSSNVQRRERQLKQQTRYKNLSINASLHCWNTLLKSRRKIDYTVATCGF